jgi:hypothetical protein
MSTSWNRIEVKGVFGRAPTLKNSSRAADPRSSIVEQLHRGSQILESVWYSSNVVPMSLTLGPAHQKEKKRKIAFSVLRNGGRVETGAARRRPAVEAVGRAGSRQTAP